MYTNYTDCASTKCSRIAKTISTTLCSIDMIEDMIMMTSMQHMIYKYFPHRKDKAMATTYKQATHQTFLVEQFFTQIHLLYLPTKTHSRTPCYPQFRIYSNLNLTDLIIDLPKLMKNQQLLYWLKIAILFILFALFQQL